MNPGWMPTRVRTSTRVEKRNSLHGPGFDPGQLVFLLGRKSGFDIFAGILEENGGQKAYCCDAVGDPFFFVCFG